MIPGGFLRTERLRRVRRRHSGILRVAASMRWANHDPPTYSYGYREGLPVAIICVKARVVAIHGFNRVAMTPAAPLFVQMCLNSSLYSEKRGEFLRYVTRPA